MAEFEWLNALDVDNAIANVRTDIYGDWYKDPWDWPELEWIGTNGAALIEERLRDDGVRSSFALDVPKENFGIRPAQILDLLDRICYQALLDRLSRRLIGNMRPWVYSWRLNRERPTPGTYNGQGREWQLYRESLVGLSDFYDAALVTDVTSFFASISPERIIDRIYQSAGKSKVSNRLVEMIGGWDRKVGRSGIPQRANASSVLANAFLQPLDDLLAQKGVTSSVWKWLAPEGSAVRWLDDMWLFGHDPGELREAQVDIDEVLRSLGLVTNLAKTSVLEGDDLVRHARQLEHSAVDQGLSAQPIDLFALDKLVERIIAEPEKASRTSISFSTLRIRMNDLRTRATVFQGTAHRMPHGAEHLARMFRDSRLYRDLDDWYIDHLDSPWSRISLAAANLAKMFPKSDAPSDALSTTAKQLAHSTRSLPLLAWSLERLTQWSPDDARHVARQRARDCERPEERRLLALAALATNEERHFIRELLSEFKENEMTLRMIDDRNFAPVKASEDFAGG